MVSPSSAVPAGPAQFRAPAGKAQSASNRGQSAAVAAAYFGAGCLLAGSGINVSGLFPPVIDPPEYSWLLLLVLGCAGLLFRRSHVPVMLAVTGAVVAVDLSLGGGLLPFLLLFELFYSGILFGTPRISQAVKKASILTAALLALGIGMANREWAAVVFGVLQASIICLVPFWWAGTLRRQTDLAERERVRADTEQLNAVRTAELAELNLRIALTAERGAMARELHDAIAGHLSAVALQSGAALAAANPVLDRKVLAQVRIESVQALNEMRAMIDLLESGAADPKLRGDTSAPAMAGGLDDLEALARSARLAGNPVDFFVAASGEVPALVHSSVYRIVQESLTNAVRHAPGQQVRVHIRRDGGEMLLRVENILPASGPAASGSGPNGPGNGTGLRNMALRADQLAGSFTAGRRATPGGPDTWQVEAVLPLTPSLVTATIPARAAL